MATMSWVGSIAIHIARSTSGLLSASYLLSGVSVVALCSHCSQVGNASVGRELTILPKFVWNFSCSMIILIPDPECTGCTLHST